MLMQEQPDYLYAAIQQDRIAFAYQPIVCAATHEIKSYECLLRIIKEDGALISAGPYITASEKYGSFTSLKP